MTAVSTARVVPLEGGRHRLGRPGLIPVGMLATVVRRGFLSWFRPGKHRRQVTRVAAARTARPVPASV